MTRWLLILFGFATAMMLVGCKRVSENILNSTGGIIQIAVEGDGTRKLAYGQLSPGTALSMPQPIGELTAVSYRTSDARDCRLNCDQIAQAHSVKDGIWILDLRGC